MCSYNTVDPSTSPELNGAFVWRFSAEIADNKLDQRIMAASDCFARGRACESDGEYEKAFTWYLKAAQDDYAEAQARLGHMLNVGIGTERDLTQAVVWLKRAADQGMALAQSYLATLYYNGEINNYPDYTEAIMWYIIAANQGFPHAQCCLGDCYLRGHGTPVNKSLAIYWYERAAQQNDARAQSKLGRLLMMEPDTQNKGIELLEKAAVQHNPQAQYYYGMCFAKGIGSCERDYGKAAYWYKCAADAGYKPALYALGEIV